MNALYIEIVNIQGQKKNDYKLLVNAHMNETNFNDTQSVFIRFYGQDS